MKTKEKKSKGHQKLITVLIIALIVLVLSACFIYAYKFTDIFDSSKTQKITAQSANPEEVDTNNILIEDKDMTDVNSNSETPTEPGLTETTTTTTTTTTTVEEISASTTPTKDIIKTTSGDKTVTQPTEPLMGDYGELTMSKPTMQDILEADAEVIIKEMAASPTYTASKLCTDPAMPTDIGRIIFPTDTKYEKLKFLGQLFTAAKCGNDRLLQIWGMNGEMYSLGSQLTLNKAPTGEFLTALKNLGYTCDGSTKPEDCKNWSLSKEVSAKSLVILEPFVEYIDSDDCINCG